jgi:hypothetical protein
MQSKLLQFHASPADLIKLIEVLRASIAEVYVYVWTTSGKLFELKGDVEPPSDADRVVASTRPIDHREGNFSALLNTQPGILVIEVPRLRNGELREVAAMARSLVVSGDQQVASWKPFFQRLRGLFQSGALLTSSASGPGRYYKNAHALSGALAMQKRGIRLLAAAGDVVYDYFAPKE